MRVPERGPRRYFSLAVLVTILWGVVFGVIEGDLGSAGNWIYAAFPGLIAAIFIAVVDRLGGTR